MLCRRVQRLHRKADQPGDLCQRDRNLPGRPAGEEGDCMTSVLVVDDKEENAYYLQALLTGHGYSVESARHGAEALVKARLSPPDVIISDLLMPVMDGYTLLRHWKADIRLKRVPFVVYTA